VTGTREGLARFVLAVGAAALSATALIALVFVLGPLERVVRAAPFLAGPMLWVGLAAGSAGLLAAAGRAPRPGVWAIASATGAVVDVAVVLAWAPWPGLVAGVLVFAAAVALAEGRATGRFGVHERIRRVRPAG
jgi:hypothetical protein